MHLDLCTGCWIKNGPPPCPIFHFWTIIPTILKIFDGHCVPQSYTENGILDLFCQKFQKVLRKLSKRGKFVSRGGPFLTQHRLRMYILELFTWIVSALSFGMSKSFSLRFSTLLARSSIDCFLGLGVVVLLERVLPMLDWEDKCLKEVVFLSNLFNSGTTFGRPLSNDLDCLKNEKNILILAFLKK